MSSDGDKTKEMQAICRLITWLDGYANLSCVDPVGMEKVAKLCGEDVQEVWNRARGDVLAIARLPGSSEKVVRLGRMVNISRYLFFGFVMVALLFWLLAGALAPGLLSQPGMSLIVLGVIAVFLNGNLILYMYSTRSLSSAVRGYFQSHRNEAKFQRGRVKGAAQSLIDKLASKVRSSGSEPEDYRFTLLDSGYSNIKATKGEGNFSVTVRL